MSTGTVAAVAYGLSAAWAFRFAMRFEIDGQGARYPVDWETVIVGVVFGVIAAMFGPVVVVGALLYRLLAPRDPGAFARAVAGEGREVRAKRLAREAKEREQYIARLERELEIGT